MSSEQGPLGIFTTDHLMVVRSWDAWLAAATGIPAEAALNRPLASLFPEIRVRGALDIIEEVLLRGTIEVLAPALHHYLIPCAPLRPSTMFERMQQHVTIGPLREDGRIVGSIVTIEDVTARVEREHQIAERLSGKEGADGKAAGQLMVPDSETRHIESLTRLMGDADRHVRRTAVASLAGHGRSIVDALVRTLRDQHTNLAVLSSALDLLAVSDIDVVEPVAALLDDDDPNLRIQAALILGERGDSRAVPMLTAHLSDPDVNVQFHVIEALGRLQAGEATEALIAIAEQRDFFLAFPAIQALSRLGHGSVAPRLVPLLADDILRAPVIEALGELGDEDVAVPLVRLLNQSDAPADVIAQALTDLFSRYESRYGAGDHIAALVRRSITATGTQRVLDAVQRASADRLPGLARILGWLDGEAAQRALTLLLGHAAVRTQVVEALVRYGSGVVALLVDQLGAEDLDTRQAAAVALGRIGDRRATAALVGALTDAELALPAAGALARIGDHRAFEGLMALLRNEDSAIRQAAIAALNSIGHPDMPQHIVPLLDDPDPRVRESAVKIAGYFGYPQCVERVLARCTDDAEMVRRAAVEHLPFFDDARVFDALARTMAHDTAPVRAAAASALARVDHPARIDVLVHALADSDPWVRYFALRTLGAIADPRAAPAVIECLRHDSAAQVRLSAIEAIGRLRAPEALGILEPMTRGGDDDVARAAIRAIGHIEWPEALACLERLLRASEVMHRLETVAALAVRGETRVAPMLQWVAAADDHTDVCRAAIEALARLGAREDESGTAATNALLDLTSEPGRRDWVIAALSTLPVRRINDLAEGLRHRDVEVRRATVEVLSRMKQGAATAALEMALVDPEPAVRLTAVIELKHLGARSSQRKLMVVARTDPQADVRQAALAALTHPGEVDASDSD
jgi:HEAT repeat protein